MDDRLTEAPLNHNQDMLPRPETLRKPIPRELIAQAYAGSVKALWDISYRLSFENCSADVLRLALKTLSAGIDNRAAPEDGSSVGVACLTILGTTVHSGKNNPKLREILISELDNPVAADILCEWIDRCLYIAVPLPYRKLVNAGTEATAGVQQNCILLDNLINIDDRVFRAFLSSPRFANLLIRVWIEEVQSTKELFMYLNEGYKCPASSIWLNTIEKEGGLGTLLKVLLSDTRRTKQFAFAMVRRARQARDKISPSVSPYAVALYFEALLDILAILIPESDHLRRRLVQADYLTQYSKVLYEITSKVTDSDLKGEFRPVITTVARLAKLVYDQQGRVLKNWRDLIKGDFLPLVTRIISVIPLHDDEYQNYTAFAILQNLGSNTVFPSIIKALPSTHGMEALMKKVDLRRNAELAKEWAIFCTAAMTRNTILHLNTFTICDNSMCKRFHLRVGQKQPRQCSRCSSVVYCSDECQREDWVRWHRTECFPAMEIHYVRKSSENRYSHSSRMYHMKFLEATFNHDRKSITEPIRETYPNARSNEILPAINACSTTLHLEMIDLTNQENWWRRPDTMFPTQAHMKPRTIQLIKNYYHNSFQHDVRLLEGTFPLGMKEVVHLTVALRYMSDALGGMFKAIHGVARYGEPTPEAVQEILCA